MRGFDVNFIVTASPLVSILIDLDHLFLANKVGSMNPLKIYRYCVDFKYPIRGLPIMNFGGG